MASKKAYVVVKNSVEIQKLNTLIAARKLADEEGAEVFCDGLQEETASWYSDRTEGGFHTS